MDRRDFFKISAGTTAVAASLPEQIQAGAGEDPTDLVSHFGPRLDKALSNLGTLVETHGPDVVSPDAAVRGQFKAHLRAVTVAGFVNALPPSALDAPSVLRPLTELSAEMDTTFKDLTQFLCRMTSDDHHRVSQRLRDEPHLLVELTDEIARLGERLTIPGGRRQDFQKPLEQIAWRIKHQSPQLLVEKTLHNLASRLDEMGALAEFPFLVEHLGTTQPIAATPDTLKRKASIFIGVGITLLAVSVVGAIGLFAESDFMLLLLGPPCVGLVLLIVGLLYQKALQ